jgi:peptidyl-prolyl cis-trans isomerase C
MTRHLSELLVPLQRRLPPAALVALTLVGCGTHHGPSSDSSQVVVRVNDKEITINQVNSVLGAADGTITPEVTRAAVDRLVNEELLVQAALKNRLDRDPTVVQAVEGARRQVLAQSFATRSVFGGIAPSQAEEEEYYRRSPALFEERKLFQLTAFTVEKAELTDKVQAALDAAHGVDEVRAVLDKHDIRYTTQITSIVPEQLPLERLPLFAQAKVGDLLVTDEGAGQQRLMCITGAVESPVSLENARPLIRRYLVYKRREEAMDRFIKQSKATATITYVRDPGTPKAAAEGPPSQGDASRMTLAQDGKPIVTTPVGR